MKVLFGAIMAYIFPLRWTSRLYLEQQLRLNGIDARRISRACLQELADDVIKDARIIAKLYRKNVRASVVEFMDVQAIQVASILHGSTWGGRPEETDNRTREILHKHGVI